LIATSLSRFVPCWVAVITVDQLRTDSTHFSSCTGRLNMAQIGQETNEAFEVFLKHWILASLFFQFQYVKYLESRSQQPTERIGQREGNGSVTGYLDQTLVTFWMLYLQSFLLFTVLALPFILASSFTGHAIREMMHWNYPK